MGPFARLSEYLCTRTSTSVYFVSSDLLQIIPFFNFAYYIHCVFGSHVMHMLNKQRSASGWSSGLSS